MPSLQLARPVEDLSASRKGNQVLLEWTLPRKNTDRTLVKDIPETRICRHEGTGLMSACAFVATVQNAKPDARPKVQTVIEHAAGESIHFGVFMSAGDEWHLLNIQA